PSTRAPATCDDMVALRPGAPPSGILWRMAATTDDSFSARLQHQDTTIFAGIPSESTLWDRRSLLACQDAIRTRWSPYIYLEIGSHLGGSLQPHVLDPR